MFRKMMGGVAVAAVLLAAGMASAQDFSAAQLSDGVRTISADEYQGRYPGTEGERMTLAWLQAQYEAMGLEPGGPDGQWLQPVELKRYTPVAGATAGWVRGVVACALADWACGAAGVGFETGEEAAPTDVAGCA